MESRRLAAVALAVFGASSIAVAGCGGDSSGGGSADARPVVVATAPQVDGLLQALAGTGVRIETVVPATADVHDLELRPSQVRALREADLVLRPGRENDAWAQEALDQIDAEQVDVAEGLPGTQRHWWMDPTFAERAATRMAKALDEVDPDGASARAAALKTLAGELATLDAETRRCLATVPAADRKIVTDHDAAGAYAERYGLTVVGTISPGSEPEAAPSAKHIAELQDLMKRERVSAVFPIAPHGSALAATVAKRGGAELGEPLWADALPGATHEHESEEHTAAEAGETDAEHAAHSDEARHSDEAGHGDEAGQGDEAKTSAAPTLQSAARLNGEAVAEALGAKPSACSAFLG